MICKLRKRCSSRSKKDLQSTSKKIKNSLISEKDRKILASLNLECFDETYLDSINVLPPVSWKDFSKRFKEVTFEQFFCQSTTNNYPSHLKLKTILKIADLYCFFDGFKNGKEGFWRKFFKLIQISSNEFESFEEFLEEFIKYSQITEDSLVLNFSNAVYGVLWFGSSGILPKILESLSNCHLKSVVIKNKNKHLNLNKSFNAFLVRNADSLVHLEFKNVCFTSSSEIKNEIFLPKLKKIIINDCCNFELLKLKIGKKLTVLESNSDNLFPFSRGENSTNIILMSSYYYEYEKTKKESDISFVEFLKNNPFLESLVLPKLRFKKTEEIEKALFSHPNLKRLYVAIRSPIQNYLGSRNIERFAFDQDTSLLSWEYLEQFPRLSYLKVTKSFHFNDQFLHYLSLDRLEYLLIKYCIFDQKQEFQFFQCISSLKRLKALHVPIRWTKGVILRDSIESLILRFEEFWKDFHDPRKNFYDHFDEEFSNLLPKAENLKFLKFEFVYGWSQKSYKRDLREHYPKLEKAMIERDELEVLTNGFSIIDYFGEFPTSLGI